MSATSTATREDLLATANFLRVRAAVRGLVERIATGPNYHWVVGLSDGNGYATVPGTPKTHAILGDLISPEASANQADDESPADFADRLETIVREHRAAKAAKLRAELADLQEAFPLHDKRKPAAHTGEDEGDDFAEDDANAE